MIRMILWLLNFWFLRPLAFFVIQTAETNLRSLQFSKETNYAETPATPTMTVLRSTGDTLSYKKNQTNSKEIRKDRQISSVIELGDQVEGNLNIEVSLGGSYDEFISAVLGNPWTDIALTGLTIGTAAAVAGVATFTTSSTTGLIPETWVKVGGTGITANNVGPWKIKTVNAGVSIAVYDPDGLATVNSITAGTLSASWVRNGVIKNSYLLEKNFSDIVSGNAFIQYLGMRCVEMSLNMKAQAILDGSFTFWGNKVLLSSATVSGAQNPATGTPSISASANIGEIYRDDAKIAEALKDLTLTITNNPRHRPIIGSKYDDDIGYGFFEVKTSGTALTPDLTFFNDVIAHNTVSFDLPLFDANGNYLYVTIPAQKIEGNPDTPAGNQDVDTKFTGMGFIDPVMAVTTPSDAMIQFDRIVAPA